MHLGSLQTLSLAPSSLIWGKEPKALSLGFHRLWSVEIAPVGDWVRSKLGTCSYQRTLSIQILGTTLMPNFLG